MGLKHPELALVDVGHGPFSDAVVLAASGESAERVADGRVGRGYYIERQNMAPDSTHVLDIFAPPGVAG